MASTNNAVGENDLELIQDEHYKLMRAEPTSYGRRCCFGGSLHTHVVGWAGGAAPARGRHCAELFSSWLQSSYSGLYTANAAQTVCTTRFVQYMIQCYH